MYCMECGKYVGLTLTWDVLKPHCRQDVHIPVESINFNMGCIETEELELTAHDISEINFNMGCIETKDQCVPGVLLPD